MSRKFVLTDEERDLNRPLLPQTRTNAVAAGATTAKCSTASSTVSAPASPGRVLLERYDPWTTAQHGSALGGRRHLGRASSNTSLIDAVAGPLEVAAEVSTDDVAILGSDGVGQCVRGLGELVADCGAPAHTDTQSEVLEVHVGVKEGSQRSRVACVERPMEGIIGSWSCTDAELVSISLPDVLTMSVPEDPGFMAKRKRASRLLPQLLERVQVPTTHQLYRTFAWAGGGSRTS